MNNTNNTTAAAMTVRQIGEACERLQATGAATIRYWSGHVWIDGRNARDVHATKATVAAFLMGNSDGRKVFHDKNRGERIWWLTDRDGMMRAGFRIEMTEAERLDAAMGNDRRFFGDAGPAIA